MSTRKRLGQILVEAGRVSAEETEEALRVQRHPGESRMIGQILVARGYASAASVKVALAKQTGTP